MGVASMGNYRDITETVISQRNRKVCAGPTFVGVMLNQKTQMFEVFMRKELPRTKFTYLDAVDELIRVNADIDPDWIYMDKGAGDVQYELIKKHGVNNPASGLTTKVVANQLAEKTNIIDIHTGKATKMPIKPTMINNAALVFEKEKIALNPHDILAKEQIESFKIKRMSTLGQPIYEDGNDHIIDALSRALFGFAKQYDDLFKRTMVTTIRYIDQLDKEEMDFNRADMNETKDKYTLRTLGVASGMSSRNNFYGFGSGVGEYKSRPKMRGMPSRRKF